MSLLAWSHFGASSYFFTTHPRLRSGLYTPNALLGTPLSYRQFGLSISTE
jgi:hypothetical protein